MCVYLHTKFHVFQVSGMIQRVLDGLILHLPPPTSKRTPKKSTQIRINISRK